MAWQGIFPAKTSYIKNSHITIQSIKSLNEPHRVFALCMQTAGGLASHDRLRRNGFYIHFTKAGYCTLPETGYDSSINSNRAQYGMLLRRAVLCGKMARWYCKMKLRDIVLK